MVDSNKNFYISENLGGFLFVYFMPTMHKEITICWKLSVGIGDNASEVERLVLGIELLSWKD